jgi:isopentenyl diphosphate isomerase/L-lactate dehydrogenase-like FMN-dependent dehydrogenase
MRDQNPEEAAATRLAAAGLDFQTLHEIVAKARQNLNQNDWDYIVGAAETETTLRRNRLALDQIAFRPRVLRDVSRIDATVQQFGRRLRLPLVFAPVGALESFNEMAAAAVVRSAREFGIAHMLSSVCAPGLEKVAAAAPDAARTTSRSIARHLRQLRHSAPSG